MQLISRNERSIKYVFPSHLFEAKGSNTALYIKQQLLYCDPNSYTKGRLTSDERSEARRRRLGRTAPRGMVRIVGIAYIYIL
jgi:hypothetical protein